MFRKLALLLAIVAATCVGAQTGHALSTANRTFVSNSGLAGNTSEGCSAASPCDTFANALSVTSTGGEINCLNAGDFGTVTITQAVTINCQGTSNGGITASGVTAVTVNTTGSVNLIGLALNGLSGADGVDITAAANVTILNCKIYGFSNGIRVTPGASGGIVVVDNVLVSNNNYGIAVINENGIANMTVRNSDINNNANAGILIENVGGTHAGATIEQTTLAFNGTGLQLQSAGAVAVIGGSTLVNNGTGVSNSGGIVYSFKNNQIGGNNTNGTPLTAYPGGPLN